MFQNSAKQSTYTKVKKDQVKSARPAPKQRESAVN